MRLSRTRRGWEETWDTDEGKLTLMEGLELEPYMHDTIRHDTYFICVTLLDMTLVNHGDLI